MKPGTRNILRGLLATAAALLLPALPAAVHAAAAPDLVGVWQGKLAVDANTSLAVQFTFTKGSNGAYTAVLNSPDNPALKNTPVSGVSWDGSNLKLQVPALSGSYAGALKDGKVNGQWTQPGGALPLVLSPYQKPVLTAASVKTLTGAWSGALSPAPGITQNMVFQFKQGAGGALEGTLNLPDQSVTLPMTNIVLENGELSLKIQQGQTLIDYKGKLAGEQITGKLKVPSPAAPPDGFPLNLKRGEYKAVVPALKLSAEAFATLKGKWQGKMEVPIPAQAQGGAAAASAAPTKVAVVVEVRFEANAKGEYTGHLDVTTPGQPAGQDFAIAEAAFADGKLTVKVPAASGAEFTGTVAGNTATGTWSQPALGRSIPLVLTRQ